MRCWADISKDGYTFLFRIKQSKEKSETLEAEGYGLKDIRMRGLIDLHLGSNPYGPDAPRP